MSIEEKASDWRSFRPSNLSLSLLRALNLRGGMYEGTADPAAVARRRAKNKVARRSRRTNRR